MLAVDGDPMRMGDPQPEIAAILRDHQRIPYGSKWVIPVMSEWSSGGRCWVLLGF